MEGVQSLIFYSPVAWNKKKNPAAQWERQHSFQSSKISILREKKKKKALHVEKTFKDVWRVSES